MALFCFAHAAPCNSGSRVATLVVSTGVMGFLGDLREDRSRARPRGRLSEAEHPKRSNPVATFERGKSKSSGASHSRAAPLRFPISAIKAFSCAAGAWLQSPLIPKPSGAEPFIASQKRLFHPKPQPNPLSRPSTSVPELFQNRHDHRAGFRFLVAVGNKRDFRRTGRQKTPRSHPPAARDTAPSARRNRYPRAQEFSLPRPPRRRKQEFVSPGHVGRERKIVLPFIRAVIRPFRRRSREAASGRTPPTIAPGGQNSARSGALPSVLHKLRVPLALFFVLRQNHPRDGNAFQNLIRAADVILVKMVIIASSRSIPSAKRARLRPPPLFVPRRSGCASRPPL